ncbi:MAG: hypothetical protein SGILL_009597 [Bacillariaceae sp.]
MGKEYFASTDDDLKNVRKIADDSKELILYRCEAAFTYALLSWIRKDREEAAEYYREVSRVADKMKKNEKRHKVLATQLSADGNRVIGMRQATMEELLGGVRNLAAHNLRTLTSQNFVAGGVRPPTSSTQLRSDGTPMPKSDRHTSIPIGPGATDLTKEMLNHLLSVGGEKCDCCGKTTEEKKLDWLKRCNGCFKAWYCGKDCQSQQWKAGHKQYCRKPGEFKVGDYVRLQGIQAKPELNGMVVKILGQVPNKEGRWETRVPGGDTSVSIATAKMEQLRPLK